MTTGWAASAGCGDNRLEPCPDVHFASEILVPEVRTTVALGGHLRALALNGPDGIRVDITDDQGTIAFGDRGPVNAFIFNQEIRPGPHDLTFDGLGWEDGVWYPFWLTCSDDGKLKSFYGEATDDADLVVNRLVSGSCVVSPDPSGDGAWLMTLEVPAHSLRNVAMTCGFEASVRDPSSGSVRLDLGSSRSGVVNADGVDQTVLVFTTVDCRSGRCGGGNWYELMSLVWNPVNADVGFTIWYLDDPDIMGIESANGLVLPSGPIPLIPPRLFLSERGGVEWSITR